MDHAAGSGTNAPDKSRIERHIEFAAQLVKSAIEGGNVIDKVIVVANKSDLWQAAEASDSEILAAVDTIVSKFAEADPYRVVSKIIPFSNNSRHDVAALIREAAK